MPYSCTIKYTELLECLEFACMVAPRLYQRTLSSKLDFTVHIIRAFLGKVGEVIIAQFVKEKQFPGHENIYNKMFAIYEGTKNVDNFDIKIGDVLFDVKTLYTSRQNFIIIPYDQWRNRPKNYYIGVYTDYKQKDFSKTLKNSFDSHKDLINSIHKHGKYLNNLIESGKILSETNIRELNLDIRRLFRAIEFPHNDIYSSIIGFAERTNPDWKFHKKDRVCTESPCARIHREKLKDIDKLVM